MVACMVMTGADGASAYLLYPSRTSVGVPPMLATNMVAKSASLP